MAASEYGLTRGTCFVARRLDVIAVAELLWISWCSLSAGKILLCERGRMHNVRKLAGFVWRGAAAMRLDSKVGRVQEDHLDAHLLHLPGIKTMTVKTTAYQTLLLPLCVMYDINLPGTERCLCIQRKTCLR